MKFLYLLLFIAMTLSCKKFLTIDEVEGRYLIGQVFTSDSAANTAINGLYRKWRDLYNSLSSPTILCGLSADELKDNSNLESYNEYYQNRIKSNNSMLPWADLYNIIYQANACIESLEKSPVSELRKKYYIGEAKFIRGHCYFNLVNIFGKVPLLLTTDINKNSVADRDSVEVVYEQIIADLSDAEILTANEIFSENEKERITSYAVKSFLARVYLYIENWTMAKDLADSVIQSGKYSLVSDPNEAFLAGNNEAIFQFSDNGFDANFESKTFNDQSIALSNSLVNSFEQNDLRKLKWTHAVAYPGDEYLFPQKYKSASSGDNELYTLFRLAELYLIRAEANIYLNKVPEAVDDLNIIRYRARLPLLDHNISEDSCLDAVMKERRVELFAETGHRWFDLKRKGEIDVVMSLEKGVLWKDSDSLYPIPDIDIQRNPNLEQNPIN